MQPAIDLPITTARLTVRRFAPSDLNAYLQFMLDDASTRYLAFTEEQKTDEGARGLFDYVLQSYDTPDCVHAYAIADKATDAYVGSCGFAPYDDGVVECYFCVNAERRGKGFAAEATAAMLEPLSKVVEVRAYCHPNNVAAHAVARRCGMKHIGSAQNKNTGLVGEAFVCDRTDQ